MVLRGTVLAFPYTAIFINGTELWESFNESARLFVCHCCEVMNPFQTYYDTS